MVSGCWLVCYDFFFKGVGGHLLKVIFWGGVRDSGCFTVSVDPPSPPPQWSTFRDFLW